jgi:hypothetical protein
MTTLVPELVIRNFVVIKMTGFFDGQGIVEGG